MTERTCPNGGRCPSQRCVYYLRGRHCLRDDLREHTLLEVAAEIGVTDSQISKLEAGALAKVRAILDHENLSTGKAGILKRSRRFLSELLQHQHHAPRAPFMVPADRPDPVRRGARGASVSKGIAMSLFGNLVCMLADLRTRHSVTDAERTRLTELARVGDVERFRSEAARIEATAPAPDAEQADALNAFEIHRANPHLRSFMRAAGVTKDDVIKHGPSVSLGTRVVPNLRELADATADRGDR